MLTRSNVVNLADYRRRRAPQTDLLSAYVAVWATGMRLQATAWRAPFWWI